MGRWNGTFRVNFDEVKTVADLAAPAAPSKAHDGGKAIRFKNRPRRGLDG